MEYFTGDDVDKKKKELKKKEFTVYRQSNLKNYWTCPRMFQLSQDLPEEVVSNLMQSRNTAMGLLFEGYVLGFKTPEKDIKGVGKDVKERLKKAAEHLLNLSCKEILQFGDMKVKDLFGDKASKAYFNQMLVGSRLALTGEADLFHPDFGFFDIKHTEDIEFAGWAMNATRWERLQCIVYPYLRYRGTGELHPFYYITVETKYSNPIIKVLRYKPTEADFIWLEQTINLVFDDPIYAENPGEYNENCVKQRFGKARGRCKFLEHCQSGRNNMGGFEEIMFMEDVTDGQG